MTALSIDLETYSDLDINKVGVYKYVESPAFEILLFAYAFDNEGVTLIDFTKGEVLPQDVLRALTDMSILKTAFNANFEMTCIEKHFNIQCLPQQWECTMVKALTLGLPTSLAMVSNALKFKEDKRKMKEGKDLIRYFCGPCKPTKTNGIRTRNLPEHAPEKWETFVAYCKQDVVVEREIRQKLSRYETTKREKQLWDLDQKINDRGVEVDTVLVEAAIELDQEYTNSLKREAKELTGLKNPNSVAQLKKWISGKVGFEVNSLNKDSIPELKEKTNNPDVIRLLELRQKMSKTSVKKYKAIKVSKGSDNRVRGLLQFYGANRTGRWAGRLVQVQNLPRNKIKDLDLARELVRDRELDILDFAYGNVPDILSQLIRTAFIPKDGCRFIVSDFSAIEARVIAWLAKESWRIDVFNTHGKIYEASASQMFSVPVDSITKDDPLRQKGKIAELALGYGGSVGALTSMGALEQGLEEDELQPLVTTWRQANPNITKFWWDCDKAAKKAIKERTTVSMQFGIKFIYDPGVLFIQLPSGRKLAYIRPKIEPHQTFSGDKITYEGMNQTTKKWERINTYGPKIVENIVQAVARDCLREAMFNVDNEATT